MAAPYYIVPLVEEYHRLDPDSDEAKELARKIAANIGDYASLRLVLGIDPPQFAKFYPDLETASPSTFDTIDSFLDKFAKDIPTAGYVPQGYVPEDQIPVQPQPEENPSENNMPYEYVLEEEDDIPGATVPEPESEPDFSSLMKSRRYREALEFIERQNLNNPQKSIYFAHQMRFLKKLIALENYKQQANKG